MVYGVPVGQSMWISRFTEKTILSSSSLWGIDFLWPDPADISWDHERVDSQPVLADEGIYYYLDTSANKLNNYNYEKTTTSLSSDEYEKDHWTTST